MTAFGVIYDANEDAENQAVKHKADITFAYLQSMGRVATGSEMNYWTPRTENLGQIKDAARQWLYSPAGVKDLRETLIRAEQEKHKSKPSEERINTLIKIFTPKKAIYEEIMKSTQ